MLDEIISLFCRTGTIIARFITHGFNLAFIFIFITVIVFMLSVIDCLQI